MDYKEEIRKILNEDTTIPPEQREKLEEILLTPEEIEDKRLKEFLCKTFTKQYLNSDKLGKWHGEPVANILTWIKKQGKVKESTETQHENKTCKENDDSLTSEDEMIRKMLIEFFGKGAERNSSTNGISDKDILAWIEKQKPIDENKFAKGVLIRIAMSIMQWLDANLAEGNMCLSNMECEDLENAVRNSDWQKVYGYMKKKLEKQGIKPQGKSALEAIHEQKADNANKVERKFHEGDWVVYKNDICQIVKREEGCNKLVTVFGIEKELVNERNLSTAHLWSIADAKEGDVLYSPNLKLLWIFKSRDTVYCGCNLNYNDGAICGEGYFERPTDAIPATKEQRELLFSRMTEAGYVFDFENKQLRKIEQKSDSFCKEHCKGYQETGRCFADGSCDAKIKAEPISLTPEILERNWFELKPDGWIWCKDDENEEQNYIFIQFRKGCDEVRTVELNFVGKVQGTFRQIQDVHELQNLLNVCRIKKEIEL